MFTSSFKERDESRQQIHGISHETFSTILDYIYTSRNPNIKDENVESLLEAACFLQLNYVKDLCLDHLKSMINTDNFLEIRSFASRHSFEDVFKATEKFMIFSFYQIVTSSSFLKLSEEEVVLIISKDHKDITKELIVNSVERWVNHDPSRTSSLQRLKEKIKTYDDNCILSCWSQGISNSAHEISIKFYDEKRGPWFTLTEKTLPRGATVEAMKYSDGKIYLVYDQDCVKEYDLKARCWRDSSRELDYRGDDWYHLNKSDIDNNFKFELISTIAKNCCKSPGMIYHDGKLYTTDITTLNHDIFLRSYRRVPFSFEDSLKVFDSNRNDYNELPLMSVTRKYAKMESLGKYLYVIGGESNNGNLLKNVEAYDPEANTWSTIADMNVARKNCLSVTYNGLLYAFGGNRKEFEDKTSFECYNPTTNKWTVLECEDFEENFCEQDDEEYYIVADDGWIIIASHWGFFKYNIERGTWDSNNYDYVRTNFCVVKKQTLLSYISDEGNEDSTMKRYFESLSEQKIKGKLWKD